jgi:hypothetical protein
MATITDVPAPCLSTIFGFLGIQMRQHMSVCKEWQENIMDPKIRFTFIGTDDGVSIPIFGEFMCRVYRCASWESAEWLKFVCGFRTIPFFRCSVVGPECASGNLAMFRNEEFVRWAIDSASAVECIGERYAEFFAACLVWGSLSVVQALWLRPNPQIAISSASGHLKGDFCRAAASITDHKIAHFLIDTVLPQASTATMRAYEVLWRDPTLKSEWYQQILKECCKRANPSPMVEWLLSYPHLGFPVDTMLLAKYECDAVCQFFHRFQVPYDPAFLARILMRSAQPHWGARQILHIFLRNGIRVDLDVAKTVADNRGYHWLRRDIEDMESKALQYFHHCCACLDERT